MERRERALCRIKIRRTVWHGQRVESPNCQGISWRNSRKRGMKWRAVIYCPENETNMEFPLPGIRTITEKRCPPVGWALSTSSQMRRTVRLLWFSKRRDIDGAVNRGKDLAVTTDRENEPLLWGEPLLPRKELSSRILANFPVKFLLLPFLIFSLIPSMLMLSNERWSRALLKEPPRWSSRATHPVPARRLLP